MFGLGRNVTLALVGWLWADILLGLFVVFLAAASPPIPPARSGPSIDPKPLQLTVAVDGSRLLGADDAAIAAEQTRFVDAVKQQLVAVAETRPIAIVFAYGSHEDPVLGEKLARVATTVLTWGQFTGAALTSLHDIVPGDRGTTVALEIYLYR